MLDGPLDELFRDALNLGADDVVNIELKSRSLQSS